MGSKPNLSVLFNMKMPDDLKYRAKRMAKKKALSLAGYICTTLANQLEKDEHERALNA